MKVLLVNGSPKEQGSTFTALTTFAEELNKHGIETEFFHLSKQKAIEGCRACYACVKTKKCVIDDIVNEFSELAATADAFVFGSPVHYVALSGGLTSFLDRVFFTSRRGEHIAGKPVSGVVICRRGGATAALDQLYKYFAYCHMPIVTGQYWNMVHGHNPEQVVQDLEGIQNMRTLGKNMAWLLNCIAAGKAAGHLFPEHEPPVMTNFIR